MAACAHSQSLSFQVSKGRFFVLFGPSSVGKTTTLRAIAGLVQPDSGTICISGVDVTGAPIKGRGTSMVFQSFALYPHLTVFRNLAYPLAEAGVTKPDIDKRVRETAEMLHLNHRLEHQPGDAVGWRAAACCPRPIADPAANRSCCSTSL